MILPHREKRRNNGKYEIEAKYISERRGRLVG